MHAISFVNQKGGCGKTTTTVHLAGALAAQGARVLVVDVDPQAHATLGLGCAVEDEPTLVDVLLRRTAVRDSLLPAAGGLVLLPATAELAAFEESAAVGIRPEQELLKALRQVRERFDFALLDCPARADSALTANALTASDTAVLVVECGAYALQGALRTLPLLERGEFGPRHRRVLATLLERSSRMSREVLIAIQARFEDLAFNTAVPVDEHLREAAAFGVPVQELAPESPAAHVFAHLASEVRRHVLACEDHPAMPRTPRASTRPTSQVH